MNTNFKLSERTNKAVIAFNEKIERVIESLRTLKLGKDFEANDLKERVEILHKFFL